MLSLEFPYTACNFVRPEALCLAAIEAVDTGSVVRNVQSCGTDVVFWQDKYNGLFFPYVGMTLVKDEERKNLLPEMQEKNASTFLSVFKTPFVESAFRSLAERLDMEVLERVEINVMSADEKFVTQSTVLDAMTLYSASGVFSAEALARMMQGMKSEDANLHTKEQYWGSLFGYTLAPFAVSKLNFVVKRHSVKLRYSSFD